MRGPISEKRDCINKDWPSDCRRSRHGCSATGSEMLTVLPQTTIPKRVVEARGVARVPTPRLLSCASCLLMETGYSSSDLISVFQGEKREKKCQRGKQISPQLPLSCVLRPLMAAGEARTSSWHVAISNTVGFCPSGRQERVWGDGEWWEDTDTPREGRGAAGEILQPQHALGT